jgi:hypothetical protein
MLTVACVSRVSRTEEEFRGNERATFINSLTRERPQEVSKHSLPDMVMSQLSDIIQLPQELSFRGRLLFPAPISRQRLPSAVDSGLTRCKENLKEKALVNGDYDTRYGSRYCGAKLPGMKGCSQIEQTWPL